MGLLRVQADPGSRRLSVDYAVKPGQEGRVDMAQALVLGGWKRQPSVTLNGRALGRMEAAKVGGESVWLVPLIEKPGVDVAERLVLSEEKWKAVREAKPLETFFRDWHVVGPFPAGGYAGENFQLKAFGPEKGLDPAAVYMGLKPGEKEPVEAPVKWRPLLKPGEPALGAQPSDWRQAFDPNGGVIGYAAASIISDEDRTVQLLTGGDERLAVWVNGERVVYNKGWRMAFRDQDRVFLKLHKGENPVLVKMGHGYESWRLYFRLADEWGLPLAGGVQFRGANGLTPAGL